MTDPNVPSGGKNAAGRIAERMEELFELVAHHARLYYEKDTPELSDTDYDALVRELGQGSGGHGQAGHAQAHEDDGQGRVRGRLAAHAHGAPVRRGAVAGGLDQAQDGGLPAGGQVGQGGQEAVGGHDVLRDLLHHVYRYARS